MTLRFNETVVAPGLMRRDVVHRLMRKAEGRDKWSVENWSLAHNSPIALLACCFPPAGGRYAIIGRAATIRNGAGGTGLEWPGRDGLF